MWESVDHVMQSQWRIPFLDIECGSASIMGKREDMEYGTVAYTRSSKTTAEEKKSKDYSVMCVLEVIVGKNLYMQCCVNLLHRLNQ